MDKGLERKRAWKRDWYHKNKEKHRESYLAKLVRTREYLNKIKDNPCVDCKQSFPTCCMDFDHVRGNKKICVSRLVKYGIKKIDEEVRKCELVCSN